MQVRETVQNLILNSHTIKIYHTYTHLGLFHLTYCTQTALAVVPQWIERWPVNQRVASSTPSQGTCLGCGPEERQPHIDVSLPL